MMVGQVRLFEKNADGCLYEVPQSDAEKMRSGRSVSRVMTEIDVLWTAEEEAAREAEELAAQEAAAASAEAARQKSVARDVALAKLQQLGISQGDVTALIS